MYRIGTLLFLLTVTLVAPSLLEAQQDDEGAIRQVLHAQVVAWNARDLPGYMAGYWKSPELTFFSGGTLTRGWEPTLERYRTRYQAEGRAMGTLDFSDLRITIVGPDAALVRGRWRLKMPDGKEPGGLFTLLVRRFPEGWRIVHDHTSE